MEIDGSGMLNELVENSMKKFIGEELHDELLECLDFLDYDRVLNFRGKSYTARELYQLYKLVRLLLMTFAHNMAMMAEAVRGQKVVAQFDLDNFLTNLGKDLENEGGLS